MGSLEDHDYIGGHHGGVFQSFPRNLYLNSLPLFVHLHIAQ